MLVSCRRSLTTCLLVAASSALTACGSPAADVDAEAAAAAEHELKIGQSDVVLTSYGPTEGECGVTACYAVTGLARPELSHFVVGTPDACDTHITRVTLNGAVVASPNVGDFAQRGCSPVHGVKFDLALRAGEIANVCISYDQELTLGEVDFQAKAGKQCVSGSIPGPTCNADERCDGRDNDCDGTTDEGFGLGDSCSEGEGACADSGSYVCAPDGNGVVCDAEPGQPTAELCGTNVDEDCDGETDEGFNDGDACSAGEGACEADGIYECTADGTGTVCNAVPGTPGDELCGTEIDEDCDGETDEGFDVGDLCSNGQLGVCAAGGEKICSDDLLGTVCTAPYIAPGTELCGTNLDEDCDGATDEEFDVGATCNNGQLGECSEDGTKECSTDRLTTVCNAPYVAPGTELCGTNLDEDCDGSTDEGFDVGATCNNGQLGECSEDGTKECSADGLATVCNAPYVAPGTELCGTNLDEDCDGETDEGFNVNASCSDGVGACADDGIFVCTADKLGTECNAVPGTPTTELCGTGIDEDCDDETDEGFNVGEACSAGDGKCEGDGIYVCTADKLATECNAEPLPPGEEICNGEDDDCDGDVDEDLTPNGEQVETPVDVDIGQSLVSLISYFLDVDANTTQVCYQVGSDFSPSLSHYVVGTDGPCDPFILSVTIDGVEVSSSPADIDQVNQGCDAIHGIKDDRGMAGGEERAFCIVYDGLFDLGPVEFQAKAGTSCETGTIDGVLCTEIDICPAT